jgi:hypothetical protein
METLLEVINQKLEIMTFLHLNGRVSSRIPLNQSLSLTLVSMEMSQRVLSE